MTAKLNVEEKCVCWAFKTMYFFLPSIVFLTTTSKDLVRSWSKEAAPAGGGEPRAAAHGDCRERQHRLVGDPEIPRLRRRSGAGLDNSMIGNPWERARQRVETPDAEKMAAATLALYEEACGEMSNLRSLA
jgi:hypothetical protein